MPQTAFKHRPSVTDLAQDALSEAQDNEQKAIALLRDILISDPDILEEICAMIIHKVRSDNILHSTRTSRMHALSTVAKVADKPREDRTKEKAAVVAMANVVGRSMLKFQLPGTTMELRQATAADITKSLVEYRHAARTMSINIRWLEAISARLQPGQKVGDVLDEVTARTLFEEAEKNGH